MTQSAHKDIAWQPAVPLSTTGGQQPHTAPLKQAGSSTDEDGSKWMLRSTKRTVSSEMSVGERGVESHGDK